jgi:hypothetical protein
MGNLLPSDGDNAVNFCLTLALVQNPPTALAHTSLSLPEQAGSGLDKTHRQKFQ